MPWQWFVYKYVQPVIVSLGLLGNLFSFVLMTSKKMRSSTFSCYLAALSVTDSLSLLHFGMDWVDDISVAGSGAFIFRVNSHEACLIYPFLVRGFFLSSAWLLMAFTLDRAFSICCPFLAHRHMTHRRSYLITFAMIIISFLSQVYHPLLLRKGTKYCGEVFAFPKDLTPEDITVNDILVVISRTGLLLIVPFLVIFISNIAVVAIVRRRGGEVRNLSPSSYRVTNGSNHPKPSTINGQTKQSQSDLAARGSTKEAIQRRSSDHVTSTSRNTLINVQPCAINPIFSNEDGVSGQRFSQALIGHENIGQGPSFSHHGVSSVSSIGRRSSYSIFCNEDEADGQVFTNTLFSHDESTNGQTANGQIPSQSALSQGDLSNGQIATKEVCVLAKSDNVTRVATLPHSTGSSVSGQVVGSISRGSLFERKTDATGFVRSPKLNTNQPGSRNRDMKTQLSNLSLTRLNSETKMSLKLLSVSVMFFVLLLPDFVVLLIDLRLITLGHKDWFLMGSSYRGLSKMVFTCNFAVNFILYSFAFRRQMPNVFCWKRAKTSGIKQVTGESTVVCVGFKPAT